VLSKSSLSATWLDVDGWELPASPRYATTKRTAAIQVSDTEDGRSRLGMMTHLPEGAQLDPCGDGFDDSTIKVRWQGCSYYVFVQDLETPKVRAASAGSAR
jgi:hypothetical protein